MDEAQLEAASTGAVLCALAGSRRGDRVGSVGAPALALRALLSATGTAPVEADARIAVTGAEEDDARRAAALLAPAGRLVGLAPDAAAAAARAERLGLVLRHVEPLPSGVAWSATAPGPP